MENAVSVTFKASAPLVGLFLSKSVSRSDGNCRSLGELTAFFTLTGWPVILHRFEGGKRVSVSDAERIGRRVASHCRPPQATSLSQICFEVFSHVLKSASAL